MFKMEDYFVLSSS